MHLDQDFTNNNDELQNSLHPELFFQIHSVSPDLISPYFDGGINQMAVISFLKNR